MCLRMAGLSGQRLSQFSVLRMALVVWPVLRNNRAAAVTGRAHGLGGQAVILLEPC